MLVMYVTQQRQCLHLKCGNEVVSEWTSVGRDWHVAVQLC